VYGASAVTAVTTQNTLGVAEVFTLPPDVVRTQIECIVQDLPLSAVKTGMLSTPEIVIVVAQVIGRLPDLKLVVDPVMTASGGARGTLLTPEAVSTLKTQLLPLASVVTPNVAEATTLSGITVTSGATAREAAQRIFGLGAKAVVVKGGHLDAAHAVDVLFDGRAFTEFSAPRLPGGSVHGTGCTFASAIAAGLALGDDLAAAVDRAKRYVTGAIEHAIAVGRGARVLNHFWLY
jgi:hydroxymethylpyrimidine/phosphomethylpyrimidine kinase